MLKTPALQVFCSNIMASASPCFRITSTTSTKSLNVLFRKSKPAKPWPSAPGISDPAFFLVRECINNDIKVECLPGATAFVPALVNSGLPTDSFCFEGFLPLKKGRHTLLTALANETRTIVLYESPVRLVKSLKQLGEYFGEDRQCSVSRELSKKFEENFRGNIKEVHDHFDAKGVRGEIVIVIAGKAVSKKSKKSSTEDPEPEEWMDESDEA